MYTLLIASNNPHKIEEINTIFSHYKMNNFRIISIEEAEKENNLKLDEPIEDGDTFKENAYIKAAFYKKYFPNFLVASDDTGLMVDSLNGAPGVHSKRYSGIEGNSELNRKKLLKELEGINNRNAHFETVVSLIDLNNEVHYFKGEVRGHIMDHEEVGNGFGYDSLFYCDELDKPFSKCTTDEKSNVSHRGRAIRALIEYLKENYE